MKVLFPVDGSENALETIRQASRFLDRSATEVYLLTVIAPMMTDLPLVAVEPDERVAAGILDAARAMAESEGFRVADYGYVHHHDPASVICHYADKWQVDQIVIGSHGYQGFSRLLLGSVSQRVLRRARQPVILLRNDRNHTVEISHYDEAGLKPAT